MPLTMLSRVEGTAALDEGITVVVPVLNEAENPQALIGEIVLPPTAVRSAKSSMWTTAARTRHLPAGGDHARCSDASCRPSRPSARPVGRIPVRRARRKPRSAGVHGRRFAERPGTMGRLFERYKENGADNARVAVLGQRAVRKDKPAAPDFVKLANRLRAAVLKDGPAIPDAA